MPQTMATLATKMTMNFPIAYVLSELPVTTMPATLTASSRYPHPFYDSAEILRLTVSFDTLPSMLTED
ncbi:MAG: hypothetical protein KGH64_02880 [Candidatus Micrarchaeota archaeon]|nr:hypothetical protein [Candidatus Micrarchaeota archaeon]